MQKCVVEITLMPVQLELHSSRPCTQTQEKHVPLLLMQTQVQGLTHLGLPSIQQWLLMLFTLSKAKENQNTGSMRRKSIKRKQYVGEEQ